MKITLELLKEMHVTQDEIRFFKNFNLSFELSDILKTKMSKKRFRYINYLLIRLMDKKQRNAYISFFLDKYVNLKSPGILEKQIIQVVNEYGSNPSEELEEKAKKLIVVVDACFESYININKSFQIKNLEEVKKIIILYRSVLSSIFVKNNKLVVESAILSLNSLIKNNEFVFLQYGIELIEGV